MHQRLADDLARLPELMRHAQERALQVLDALDDRATAQAPAPVAS